MEWVEITAKTVDAARDAALDQLGVALDDAEIDVVEDVQLRNPIEALEDKTDFPVAETRHLAVGKIAHVLPVDDVLSCVECVEQPTDVQKCRFARARRTHDGDELA